MLITSADLKTQTKNDLAQMAKRLGLAGWNALSKDQLVVAIVKAKKAGKPASKSVGSKPAGQSRITEHSKAAVAKTGRAKNTNSAAPKGVAAVKNAANVAKKSTKTATAAKAVQVSKAAGAGGKLAGKQAPKAKTAAITPSKAVAGSSKSVKAAPAKAASAKPTSGSAPIAKASASKVSSSVARPEKKNVAKSVATTPHVKTAHVGKPKTNGVMVANAAKKVAPKKPAVRKPSKPAGPPTDPAVLEQIRRIQSEREAIKDLSGSVGDQSSGESGAEDSPQKDRIVLVVRDAFWLQVNWDLTRRVVERARAAMAEHWHHAQPIIRLLRLDDTGTTSSAETIERDIPIHSGVRNWYIDLNGTPGRFRVMIGYLSGNRFHMLAKSNIVRTPTPGTTDAVDDHWSDIARDAERIFALSGGYDSEQETTELQEVFEDRLKRSMGGPQLAQYGSGAETAYRGRGGFHFDLEVELYVYGSTVPDGFVTLNGEPVKLRSDGSFAMRLPFPDRRQVLPAVACSRDGVQQRTVVIAVERNTKVMEPFSKEQDDQG